MFYDWVNACSNKTGVLDEMSIKQGVTYDRHMDIVEGFYHGQTGQMETYTLVFMVRGVIEKWKLPIGYFLSSGPMKGVTIKDLLIDEASRNRTDSYTGDLRPGFHQRESLCDHVRSQCCHSLLPPWRHPNYLHV